MNVMKKIVLASLIVANCLHINNVFAQFSEFATFEIGQGTIDSYTTTATETTPFTTIDFDGEFENPPIVFTLTPEFSGIDDPCIIRVDSITETGFDATCLESVNEDRNIGVDIPFTYIAIQESGVSVPLTSGSGTVDFQVACNDIDAEQFGPTCSGCTGPQGFEGVSFSPGFNAAPALLTQLQTTNNVRTTAPVGEPVFISAAVQTNSLSNTGYNVAVDRMEAEQSPLSPETICHLAVERNGCQDVDFSSIGGLSSVMFEALHGDNVDGHDNGCTSGEGATFASGCFTSTPVIVAAGHERAGNNGGWLRVCDVNTSEAIFTFDEDTVSNPERAHIDEDVSVLAFGELFTTPVTLSGARVSVIGRNAIFSWDTTAETFHLGFNLWGETTDGWVQLNRRLIVGNGVDTDEPQSYRQSIRLTRANREITQFGISSVDSTGYEEFYGPFSEGQDYGDEANNEPVDWTSTRSEFEQSMRERGFVKVNNRWRRPSSSVRERITKRQLGLERTLVDLTVDTVGIHSIRADELLALNPNWNRVQLDRLALTLNGQAIPRHIISDNNRLDANDQIVFNASAVSGQDTPFLEHYTYRLSLNRANALDVNVYDGSDTDQALTETALISETLTSKKLHSAGLTTGDPWYDARLLSVGNPVSVSYASDFMYQIDESNVGILDITLFGSLDLPGEGDDHHVQVSVNDERVHDVTFDGLVAYTRQLTLPVGLLKTTGNTVTVTVVGDTGFFADVVLVDEITLSAYSTLSDQERLSFDFAHNDEVAGYRLATSTNDELQVYAYTSTGLLSAVQSVINDDHIEFTGLPFQVSDTNDTQLRYAVADADNWPTPTLSLNQGEDLHSEQADYFIIAHPSFIGHQLTEFVEFKTQLGHNVRVVDWLEVVNTYGYGNNTPNALNNFLQTASELYEIENVLIVGGHTYDYFGITDQSVVNFIPSHYRAVSVFEYTATDNPYADLNGDNIPEISIGRWPVRSTSDLELVIKKTKDWHQNREDSPYQDAYLLGQAIDGQNLSFETQLRNRVRAPLLNLNEINQINQLYLDELPDGVTDVVSFTREQLASEINNGTDIISFSGHASPTAWGFQNIINTSFIQSLENQGDPILLMPLACFITHYESVSTNTLAHQWLFSGDRGAAAIHGENGLFAQRYLNQSKISNTVGEAIKKAKQRLGSGNEILHNWLLLGDPALPIR